ncbi:MAG: transcription elongation factor GreA [Candidatus Levybacteria bacterium]|nr:transcription elongation factor GreA [Candidatus Levybacteria bacterium]
MKTRRDIPVIQFTKEGYDAVKKKHDELLVDRGAAVADLSKARDMGDLSENGWYKAAKFKLGFIDRQLRELKHQIQYGKVSQEKNTGIVSVGSSVLLVSRGNEERYSIVGEYEGNPAEKKLSSVSPLGKALLGKKVGDKIAVSVPAGMSSYTILKIT